MGYFQIVAIFVHIYIYNNKNQTKRECKFESGGLGRIGGLEGEKRGEVM